MAQRLGQDLVADGLWEIVEPLIPPHRERPQGGGTRYVDDRAVFTAVVYVLTTGCAWRHLTAEFGVLKATAHRPVMDCLGERRGDRLIGGGGSGRQRAG